jgi:hypothetical protein
MSTTELAWFKSSYSGSQGDSCVEVALTRQAARFVGFVGRDGSPRRADPLA